MTRPETGASLFSNNLADLIAIIDAADRTRPTDPLAQGINHPRLAIETELGYLPNNIVCPVQIVPGNKPFCALSRGGFDSLYALRPDLSPNASYANKGINFQVHLTRYTDVVDVDLKNQEPIAVRLKFLESAQGNLVITSGLAELIGGNAIIKIWDEKSQSILDVGGIELKDGDLVILQLISATADQGIDLATL